MKQIDEEGGGHKHGTANKHWDCDATAQVPAKASDNRSYRHGKVVPAVKDAQTRAAILRTQGLGWQGNYGTCRRPDAEPDQDAEPDGKRKIWQQE